LIVKIIRDSHNLYQFYQKRTFHTLVPYSGYGRFRAFPINVTICPLRGHPIAPWWWDILAFPAEGALFGDIEAQELVLQMLSPGPNRIRCGFEHRGWRRRIENRAG